jgi:hypothetical protein
MEEKSSFNRKQITHVNESIISYNIQDWQVNGNIHDYKKKNKSLAVNKLLQKNKIDWKMHKIKFEKSCYVLTCSSNFGTVSETSFFFLIHENFLYILHFFQNSSIKVYKMKLYIPTFEKYSQFFITIRTFLQVSIKHLL